MRGRPFGVVIVGCMLFGGVLLLRRCYARELPADDRVYILTPHHAFAVDRRPVTAHDAALCIKAGGCAMRGATVGDGYPDPDFANHPSAADFCAWRHARLPTPAEWRDLLTRSDVQPSYLGEWLQDGYSHRMVHSWRNVVEDMPEIYGPSGYRCVYSLPYFP